MQIRSDTCLTLAQRLILDHPLMHPTINTFTFPMVTSHRWIIISLWAISTFPCEGLVTSQNSHSALQDMTSHFAHSSHFYHLTHGISIGCPASPGVLPWEHLLIWGSSMFHWCAFTAAVLVNKIIGENHAGSWPGALELFLQLLQHNPVLSSLQPVPYSPHGCYAQPYLLQL